MYSRPLFYDILVPKLKQPVPTKVLKLEKKTEINIGDYSTSLEVKVSLKSLNFGVEKVIKYY